MEPGICACANITCEPTCNTRGRSVPAACKSLLIAAGWIHCDSGMEEALAAGLENCATICGTRMKTAKAKSAEKRMVRVILEHCIGSPNVTDHSIETCQRSVSWLKIDLDNFKED